jgi:hypothetical protein
VSEFWWGLIWLSLFIPLMFLWGFALWDVFSRQDLRGWAKALWAIAIVFFPLIGLLAYFIVRPKEPAGYGGYAYMDPYTATYRSGYPYGSVPQNRPVYERASGPAPDPNDMATLNHLHETGTLNDEEFANLQGRITGQQKEAA